MCVCVCVCVCVYVCVWFVCLQMEFLHAIGMSVLLYRRTSLTQMKWFKKNTKDLCAALNKS